MLQIEHSTWNLLWNNNMHYFPIKDQIKYIIEISSLPTDEEQLLNKTSVTNEKERRQKLSDEFEKSCSVYPNSPNCKAYNVNSLRKAMDDMNFLDPYARAALIGNVQKETGNFKWVNEAEMASPAKAKDYTFRMYGPGNPKKQKELGNRPQTEDYFNFRGFGPIQITGRANWEKYAKKANLLKQNETIDEFEKRVRGKGTAETADVEAAFKMSLAYIQDRFPSQMGKLSGGVNADEAAKRFTNEAMIRAINPGLYKNQSNPKYRDDIQSRLDFSNEVLQQEIDRPKVQLEYLKTQRETMADAFAREAGGWVGGTPEEKKQESPKPSVVQSSSIKVKSGDTLSRIAKENGVSVQDILKANKGIEDPNKIKPGQNIIIPKK